VYYAWSFFDGCRRGRGYRNEGGDRLLSAVVQEGVWLGCLDGPTRWSGGEGDGIIGNLLAWMQHG
jgi:hypothetical protein